MAYDCPSERTSALDIQICINDAAETVQYAYSTPINKYVSIVPMY